MWCCASSWFHQLETSFFRRNIMILIGEKINGTRKKVNEAILSKDELFISELARKQFEAGAKYLDVNAGTLPSREPDDLVWLARLVQKAAPEAILCLDSANPEALEAGLKIAEKTPMVNSLSGENARLKGVLPLAAKYGTELVVLALDDNGIPETAEKRLEIVRNLIGLCKDSGIGEEKLYVDPLVLSISTGNHYGRVTLDTMTSVKQEFPKVKLTCGHSNISYGMPLRSMVNQAFMVLTVAAGLDSAIVDPEKRDLIGMIMATEALLGQDRHCLKFNRAFRAGKIGPPKS
jgi:5-methyltetrahydrofolate--homocysteine methyltransferase